jgi:hypothetical protein
LGLVLLSSDHDLLDIEDDVDHILDNAGDGRELVLHTFDLQRGHGRTGDPGQQGSPKRIAEGVSETRFEWFDDEPGAGLGDGLFFYLRALDDQHSGFPLLSL